MSDGNGFSPGSVILGLFLVAGGLGLVILGLVLGEVEGEWVPYAMFGGGGFVGGWFAARASRGSTVIEPAISALLFAGLVVGTIAATPFASFIWAHARDESVKTIISSAGPLLGGSLIGAYLSEKLLGEATRSSLPWILYFMLAALGGCLVAMIGGALLGFVDPTVDRDRMQMVFLGLIAAGCLLSGIAGGAIARTRPLGAGFLGGALGTAGFFLLAIELSRQGGADMKEGEMYAGAAILGAGGGLATTLGAWLGWSAIGRRHP